MERKLEIALSKMNDKQSEAILYKGDRLLVLAGAGSGKTRVLTHRIAKHIIYDKFSPENIIALTFTNKAAKEMKDRVADLVGERLSSGVFLGTFHSFSARFLRKNHLAAGLPQNFQILDGDDQKTLINDIINGLRENEIRILKAEKKTNPNCDYESRLEIIKEKYKSLRSANRSILAAIDKIKNNEIPRSSHLSVFEKEKGIGQYIVTEALLCFENYEMIKSKNGLVDFNDLLLITKKTLESNDNIRLGIQNQMRVVLADEYQDTNHTQEAILGLIAHPSAKIMVVGDEDQLIYSWRGAVISNILNFDSRYNAGIVKLEQNYRSTKNIIAASNAIINKNIDRKGKSLWTSNEQGQKITQCVFNGAFEEADFVAEEVKSLHENKGVSLKNICILYRNNYLSSLVEKSLYKFRIPSTIYGGIGFWARQEVKDIMAFLKWAASPNNVIAIKRALSVKKIGYGDKKHSDAMYESEISGKSLEECLRDLSKKGRGKFKDGLIESLNLIDRTREKLKVSLKDGVEHILKHSGVIEIYEEKEEYEDFLDRQGNMLSILDIAQDFINEEAQTMDMSDIDAFIVSSDLQLEASEKKDQNIETVSLMTVHASKGLEYDYIFIVGFEEGIFPSKRSIEADDVEEERRLAYVGCTRAKKKLYTTSVSYRHNTPTIGISRFIKEIPSELKEVKGNNRNKNYF